MSVCVFLRLSQLVCIVLVIGSAFCIAVGCDTVQESADLASAPVQRGQRHNQFAVRWILVSDSSGDVASTLDTLAPIADDEMTGIESLRDMGMQIRQLSNKPGSIKEVVRSLGPAAADLTTWHGAIYQWRALLFVAMGPAPRAVAVAGQMRTLPAGVLSLDCRAWPLLTEAGEQLYLELVPVYQGERFGAKSNGNQASRRQVFRSAAITLMLEADEAYAISSVCPDPAPASVPAGPVDPLDAHGDRQWTLGELLFTRDMPKLGRGVLIILPWGADQANF